MSTHIGTPGLQLGRRLVGVEDITQLDPTKLKGKTRWCVSLRDDEGNRIVVFSNTVLPLRKHTMTFVDGIVKRHSEHNGVLQTEISEPRFYRTGETVADYNVAERLRVLCYRIGVTGTIVAPRIIRFDAELPEDLAVIRSFIPTASHILRRAIEVVEVAPLAVECRITEEER